MSFADPHIGDRRQPSSGSAPERSDSWLRSDSAVADAIRDRDWSDTPLGPLESWPQRLRTTLQNALNTEIAMSVCWGDELLQLYNDAHAETIMGTKHPRGLGRPVADNWSEVWAKAGDDFRRAYHEGIPVHRNDAHFFIDRDESRESAYFSYSLSPIVGDTTTDGLLLTASNTTGEVLGQRRLQILSDLGAELSKATSPAEVFERTAEIIGDHHCDLPFALMYRQGSNPDRAELVASPHLDGNDGWSPDWIELPSRPPVEDRLARCLTDPTLSIIDLETYFGPVPVQLDATAPRRGVVAPIPFDVAETDQPVGCLVLGLSPFLTFDDDYRNFVTELIRTTSAAFQRARARHQSPQIEGLRAELTRSEIESGRLQQRARLVEKIEKPFYALDQDFRVVYANDAMRNDPHFADRKVVGCSFWELLPWTTNTRLYQAFHDAMETGETVDLELESPENNRIHHIFAIGTGDGLAVFCEDVTRQRRTAEALERTEARFRAVVEASLDVIAITDREGRFQFTSPATGEIFGLDPDELQDRTLFELLGDDDADEARRAYDRLIEDPDSTLDLQVPFEPPGDGRQSHWLDISGRNLLESQGVDGVLLNIRDITDLKRAQHQLVDAKERAEEMTRVKSELLSNLSHEIRTPLTSVIGIASLLDDDVAPQHRDALDNIKRGAIRLEQTLDSVLNLARIEDRKLDVTHRRISLADQVETAAESLRDFADDNGLTLQVHRCDEPEVCADPSFLTTILEHLLRNGLKFTETGGVDIYVRADDSRGIVEIEDTGIGISAEFLPRLFEAFRQESTGLSRSYGGVGVGLTIARRLTETIGGRLTVSTVPGGGSIFTLALPGADASEIC